MTLRRGATVWFTGLPASGKTTLSASVQAELAGAGRPVYRLDGDELRRNLCADLGFEREDRAENVRRAAHVARLLADAGIVVLVALVSPYASDRDRAREIHRELGLPFVEVFLDTPVAECRRRDPKGMYARAQRGELAHFTGVDDPYEPPQRPELCLEPRALADSVRAVMRVLDAHGVL